MRFELNVTSYSPKLYWVKIRVLAILYVQASVDVGEVVVLEITRRSSLTCCCCWEDAVDEIGLLKTRLEERDRDEVAANEKYAALSKECKGRGKEIAAMREAVANMKKGKRDKEVEKAVQTEVTEVLVAGTQTERCTYASILAQTEEVNIGGENTDKMDIDTPPPPTNKPTSPATTPLANTSNATPTSAHLSRAFVVHGIACSGPWTQKIQEVERAFGRRGGGVIGFFFFFFSVVACGLDHGEAPGPRTGPLCQDGQ